MAWYQKAGDGVHNLAHELIDKHYLALKEAGVKVEVMFAYAPKDEETGEPLKPAIKSASGWPAAGKVRVLPQKDRAAGRADAEIILDGDRWTDHSDRRQEAILCHEIHHLEVVKDEDGNIKLDDCNRPKLKLRIHDMEIGVFAEIVERYEHDALDTDQCVKAVKWVQEHLNFG